jgi:hypothetical protein
MAAKSRPNKPRSPGDRAAELVLTEFQPLAARPPEAAPAKPRPLAKPRPAAKTSAKRPPSDIGRHVESLSVQCQRLSEMETETETEASSRIYLLSSRARIADEPPASLAGLERAFDTEKARLDYLAATRWPDGPRCPACQGREPWRSGPRLICSACGKEVRVLAGTVLQDSKLPLEVWFRALWLMVENRAGLNARRLGAELGVRTATAWGLLRKSRAVMAGLVGTPLSGLVEVGLFNAPGAKGPGPLVAAAVERVPGGETRLEVVGSPSELGAFTKRRLSPAARVVAPADGAAPRRPIGPYDAGVKAAADLLARWLDLIWRTRPSAGHLQGYLDEFAFRLDHRKVAESWNLFELLVGQALRTPPLTG